MRKRSSHKPRPIIPDMMAWIKQGDLPLTAATTTMTRVKIANHGAMERLVKGKGTGTDIVALGHMITTAKALCAYGIGEEWLDAMEKAGVALDAVTMRSGGFIMRAEEMNAINLAIEIHDRQLEQCTVRELETAIQAIKNSLRHQHALRVH